MVYFCVNITNISTQILYEPLYMTTVTYGEYVKRLTPYLRKEMCHQTPQFCMHFRKNLYERMKWHLYSANSPSLTCRLAFSGTDLTFSDSSHNLMVTGHGNINSYVYRFKISDIPSCRADLRIKRQTTYSLSVNF